MLSFPFSPSLLSVASTSTAVSTTPLRSDASIKALPRSSDTRQREQGVPSELLALAFTRPAHPSKTKSSASAPTHEPTKTTEKTSQVAFEDARARWHFNETQLALSTAKPRSADAQGGAELADGGIPARARERLMLAALVGLCQWTPSFMWAPAVASTDLGKAGANSRRPHIRRPLIGAGLAPHGVAWKAKDERRVALNLDYAGVERMLGEAGLLPFGSQPVLYRDFPDTSHTTDRLKSMLFLNDDVLLLLFSFLSRKDALAVACTSKHAYCLATPSTLRDASYPLYRDVSDERSRWEYILGHDKFLGVPRRRYIRTLSVRPYPKNGDEIASLVEALPSFSNLRTLRCDGIEELIERHPRLVECIPPRSTMRTFPVLPSVRHMINDDFVSDASENIVAYCPNLITLQLRSVMNPGDYEPTDPSVLPEDAWPSLRKLDCDIPWSSSYTGRIGHASKVTFRHAHLYDYKYYLPILRKTQPSCLCLSDFRGEGMRLVSHSEFEPRQDHTKYAWKELANTLPQLRSLEANLSYTTFDEDFVNMLLDTLRPLPLTHLSLHAPDGLGDSEYSTTTMADVNERRIAEVRRVDILRALPDALARALPHVWVFSLGPISIDGVGGTSISSRTWRKTTRI
ncbi:uncharacterized protein BXZ73DRAFT_79966 [Epithele typhae]|uniref:uncharacterized protein n=1 Tax=Epithele typhae TaxID=378194 RepID=UPI002007DE99|nr:uncharacterized protein BXZ73DRAFT_79966 [Epithele typhae]KAH9921189.1 hypothetical protein BXZ73DRAFT_79966 [Epithele typhae]